MKVLIGTIGVVAASTALFYVIRQGGKLFSTFTHMFKNYPLTLCLSYREAKDHQQGMGRGNQRVHEGAKEQPYFWYCLRGLQGKGLRCFKLDRIFQQLNLNTNHFKKVNANDICATYIRRRMYTVTFNYALLP